MVKKTNVTNFPLLETNDYLFDGNLVLKPIKNDDEVKNYKAPKVKKKVFKNENITIVMGCWQQSDVANDGDGC